MCLLLFAVFAVIDRAKCQKAAQNTRSRVCVRVCLGTILLCKCAKEEVCLAFEQILRSFIQRRREGAECLCAVDDVMIGW